MNEVLDTLRISNSHILYKAEHIERTCEALAFCGRRTTLTELNEYYSALEEKFSQGVLRIVFTDNQLAQARHEVLLLQPEELPVPLKLEVSQIQMPHSNFKWADRSPWQKIMTTKSPKADDLLFVTPEGFLRESSRFNVFIHDQQRGLFITPGLETGCINGAFRRYLLKNKVNEQPTIEQNFRLKDLKTGTYRFFVGNSVRGLLAAEILHDLS
jgi:hypothetical protein